MDNAPNADLHIPEPNIFIPTDFTLHTPKEEANLISLFKEKKDTIINHLLESVAYGCSKAIIKQLLEYPFCLFI